MSNKKKMRENVSRRNMTHTTDSDAAISLAGAVISSGVSRYKDLLKGQSIRKAKIDSGEYSGKELTSLRAKEKELKELERFFHSKWFEHLSLGTVSGPDLMQHTREEVLGVAG